MRGDPSGCIRCAAPFRDPKEFVKGDRFAPRSSHPEVGLESRPVLKPVVGSTEHYYAITPELEAVLEKESH